MIKTQLALVIIFILISCGQSDKKSNVGQNSTNTAESTPDSISSAPTNPDSPNNLHDIWVLESVNNEPIKPGDFSRGTPFLNLDTVNKTISGHSGCNGLNGTVKLNGKKIGFKLFGEPKENCKNKEFENKFLRSLKSENITFSILDGRLSLHTSPSSVYTFRRIRR